MTPSDQALAVLHARWLDQGRGLQRWSLLLAASSLAAVAVLPAPGPRGAWALAMLACALGAACAAVRVGLDAALFDDFATGRLSPDALDAALGLIDSRRGRDMAARCRGARAWWWRCVAGVAAQAGLLALYMLLSPGGSP